MTTNRIMRAVAVVICSVVFWVPAQASERAVLQGHVPAAVSRLQSTGRLSSSKSMNLAIGLPLRNEDGLRAQLQQIYDPYSPNYRHYLTTEQFTEQFGPTEQDYQTLIAFAKAKGLTVSGKHPNRLILDVKGAVTDIEKAFHVTMRVYPHPTEARTFYAPDSEPSLDLTMKVLHISGLDNYSLPRPMHRLSTAKVSDAMVPNAGSGPGGNYMGSDFRAAYVPGTPLTGAGQTVGLLQFDGYNESDITYYETHAGITPIPLQNVLIDGATGTPSGGSGSIEVCLDIEMVASMAPGVSKIIVYMAPNSIGLWVDILSRMANDNLAKSLSCSWGGGDPNPSAETIFLQMAAQGQSFYNATGDSDAFTGDIGFPSDSKNITEVGGTTLTTSGTGGAWASETVWNAGGGEGSSGGISTYYAIPWWQTNVSMTAAHGSAAKRNVPDVALTADNIYVRCSGSDQLGVGGTSCAAPLWAGLTALMNEQNGGIPVGFLNPALYTLGTSAYYASCFHDITTGNNFSPSSPANFPAVAGYDLCTGWGTPVGVQLINALTKPPPPVMLSAGTLPAGRVGTDYSYTIGEVGGLPPYVWSVVSNALPLGLALSSDGVISGVPEQATTVTFGVEIAARGGSNLIATTNQFSLTILPAHGLPFTETFENGGAIPEGWTQQRVSGSQDWRFMQGSPQGIPAVAHGGSYNACLAIETYDGPVTRLVSPRIDFSGASAGQLTFWQFMAPWGVDQDELNVYYKTDVSGAWTPLGTFTTAVNTWTKQTLTLPSLTSKYYIAFEGTAKYGYGICIDDVEITDPTVPLSITTASPLPSATTEVFYSQTLAAEGGVAPYTFTLVSGALPDGMILSGGGVISGTTNAVSTNVFTVAVTDSSGPPTTASKLFSLTVELPRADLFAEDFEHGGQMPLNWTQEFVTNSVSWTIASGGKAGHPSQAASGDYNVMLWSGAWATGSSFDQKTRLVSPAINLGQAPANTRLTFWHCMEAWDSGQDELRVFYRTSATAPWNLLATYTIDVPEWTQRTLTLPNPTSTYYIAFEGDAKFGYGVCIDDVRISDSADAPIITTLGQLPNGLINVPYSQTLTAVGGKQPYAWTVVSNAPPSGLTLSGGGVLSGTPVTGGTTTFSVQVVGGDGKASVDTFSLKILDALPLPYLETFENGGTIPTGWTQDTEGSELNWLFLSGSGSGVPSSAFAGSYNACLYIDDESPHTSMLISPMLDLGTNANARLTFWHFMKYYDGDQDELRVYYRTTKIGAWNLLATYNTDVPGWTQQTVDLPNPSGTYYIAFEGTARWGYGVCIDNVYLTSRSPYAVWKSAHFTEAELEAGLITGDLDDPDGDGIVNALEYAYGLDPRVYNTTGFPVGSFADNHLTLTYRESKAASNVVFAVEACTSLVAQNWTTNGVSEILRSNSNTWWQVTDWHNVPMTNAPVRFMRLKVYLP